ncbi:hypothetical protein SNE40_006503 [Patella caerulea]|uniref:Nucleoporin NUP53 n=2 Tax=Patella caerulea TaxID=87958 RepID=A0AAN8JWN8_PATCE
MFSPLAGEYHEPMMTASPTSPGPHHSQYLPSYLLGDNVSHSGSPVPKLWSTSGQSPTLQKGQGVTSPVGHMTGTPSRNEGLRGKDKMGAPPVKGLFSSSMIDTYDGSPALQTSFAGQLHPRSPQTPAARALSPSHQTPGYYNQSRLNDSLLGNKSMIPASPAQLDPFYTQGETLKSYDMLDDTWITVFGFNKGATSFILEQFSQYGHIVKHVVATEGNWMHVHYQSKIQAKKALSKNGKIFGGCIMVGVLPCIDKNVMDGRASANDMPMTPSTPLTDVTNSVNARNTPTIRPLTSAYQATRSEYDVVKGGQIPQKDNSLMSKVKEYMLGW